MSNHANKTSAATILALISELFGPTHWNMYSVQYVLDILQGAHNATCSANALVQLIQNRPGAVLLHNDLALEVYTGDNTDLPCLQVPVHIPDHVTDEYLKLCYVENSALSVDMVEDTPHIARWEAINFLSGKSRPSPQNQIDIDTLADLMANVGL
jgi:hypothetical protein